MNTRFLLIFFSAIFLFLALPSKIFAAMVQISDVPSNIEKDQEFSVSVTLAGAASNTTNYLRAAFYSESAPTSYFGYTFNQNEWYNGTPSPIDKTHFLQIQISGEGSWSGTLAAKADLQSSYFKGGGNYFFKVGRYTAGATSVSDWSSSAQIAIAAPNPTPTPVPTAKPTKVPTPTKSTTSTKASSTKSSTTTSDSSYGSGSQTLVSQTLTAGNSAQGNLDGKVDTAVLGTEEASITSQAAQKKPEKDKKEEAKILGISKNKLSTYLLIAGSVLLLLSCGILGLKMYKKRRSTNEDL